MRGAADDVLSLVCGWVGVYVYMDWRVQAYVRVLALVRVYAWVCVLVRGRV